MDGWDPRTYGHEIRAEIPAYDAFQDEVARAGAGVRARRILELGVGSGETARRVLASHPGAKLVGIDSSSEMLAAARASLPRASIELILRRLEDELPEGPFDLVVSALAVHHLEGDAKARLFERISSVLRAGGMFVLGDVVVPEDPADAVVPLEEGYDFPSSVAEQMAWLSAAGLEPTVSWRRGDLAVLVALALP